MAGLGNGPIDDANPSYTGGLYDAGFITTGEQRTEPFQSPEVFNFRDESPQSAGPAASRTPTRAHRCETSRTVSAFHHRHGEPRTIGT